ncbi:shikimate dehydrogenase [Larsenimonas salina]|uniref:shikimate dehydrogenase n=1 Tax=Larsenimonas salina TaxID=1295565 RepID=UPI002074367F|nr:shikimate dehydrogenase [Larsenimonas salina]MCM5704351.1 shikimate dehydrogenase [Larsenimonas salina]
MSDLYCVFGHPISHSRSPALHAAFAAQTDQALHYEARDPGEAFESAWHAFVEEGGLGANVTVPFKERAYRLADRLTERASRAGAVNTLMVNAQGQALGDTTDGVGLLRDLVRLQARLEGGRILVLGAGGAVRGVLEPLLETAPATVMVANRTASKASALAEAFKDLGPVEGGHFDDATGHFDVIINGTSASLGNELPALPNVTLDETTLAYDMMYAARPTVFMTWAEALGARTSDGLGMLVEQAAASFELWRGAVPETEPVRRAVRQALTATLLDEVP